ncbi:MAG: NTP transferase domain-containing protein [Anaerolineae bacterium]
MIRQAIILAAGQGRRIWPYNQVRNKCAIPIGNVPAVRRLADDLLTLGVSRLVVVVGEHAASVRYALRGLNSEIHYVTQDWHAGGTTGATLAAWDGGEPTLVVHGDMVTARENLAALLAAHKEGHTVATALVVPLGRECPRDWIVAHLENGALRGIEGHARDGEYRLGGALVLTPEARPYLCDHPGLVTQVPVGGMPPVEADLAQSLQMMIDEGRPVRAVVADEFVVDLDKPWHILEAHDRLMGYLTAQLQESVIPASARIHDGAEIQGHVVLGENAVIGNRVVINAPVWLGEGAGITNGAIVQGPSVFGAGTQVRDYCLVGSVAMGERGIIGHGAEFAGVAFDRVYLYHYCEIWGVLGSAVDIGAATVCGTLRFDDGIAEHRIRGRRELPVSDYANATFFGDYCRTGVNVIPMPGTKVGVYSCVGAGVVVYEDIPDRSLVLQKQELITREWGPERYGW